MPEGSLPDPNLRKGDTVTLDGFLYAFYERDAGGILLGTMKAPLVKRYLSRHRVLDSLLGHSLTINRGDVSDMRPSVRRQVDKPLEQFKKRDVDEALRKPLQFELAIKMQNRPGSKTPASRCGISSRRRLRRAAPPSATDRRGRAEEALRNPTCGSRMEQRP